MATETELHARVLPPAEWADKLEGTALEASYQSLDPDYSIVVVVERGDRVVACTAFITTVYAVGLWEAEEVRGHAGVSRALAAEAIQALAKYGVGEVIAQAETEDAAVRLQRLGGRCLPGTLWVLPMGVLQ